MEVGVRTRCRHCRRPRHDGDCAVCGCVKFEPRDLARKEARKRLWLVEASFLVRRGWTKPVAVRVKAMGLSGALLHGSREARRAALKPGTRVQQPKLTALAVGKGGR